MLSPALPHKTVSLAAIALFSIITLTACTEKPTVETRAQRGIEAVADEYVAAMLQRYPTMATYYDLPGARHDRLYDNSVSALETWQGREDAWLAELDVIGVPSDVGSRDWVTYGVLYEELAAASATRVCRRELWSASKFTVWSSGLPFVFEVQRIDTSELREQQLERLRQVSAYVDTEIANLRLGLKLGYSTPRLTVAGVADAARLLANDDSPFLSPAARSDDAEFGLAVRNIFDEEIVPAIERFATFMESEYEPAAREEIGLSFNPDGAECYPALVRSFSTVQLPASEVHELGLQQIEKIRAEMREIIDQHFDGVETEFFLRNLNEDPRFTFTSEDEVLQFSIAALDTAKARMPEIVSRMPKADVLIKPYPAYREGSVGEYHSSSEDGSRPGIFYIAVNDPLHRSRAAQQSTLYHETYPGHHLEQALSLELGDRVHSVARYLGNSGFSEGWGLYSERLADELGMYSSSLDRFGMLSEQGARASRLVIDTGLHTKGWTRQQAVDYMMSNSAWPEVDIQSDINRYISYPGQANAYMLGMLEMDRLRKKAEHDLGDKFDLRAFHDRLLGYGGVTLPMLGTSIEHWIKEQQ